MIILGDIAVPDEKFVLFFDASMKQLQSVFGDISYAAPPITEAEYQLSLYDWKIKEGQDPNVFEDLKYFTLEYSKDPIQNPLTGHLTLPDYMK